LWGDGRKTVFKRDVKRRIKRGSGIIMARGERNTNSRPPATSRWASRGVEEKCEKETADDTTTQADTIFGALGLYISHGKSRNKREIQKKRPALQNNESTATLRNTLLHQG